MKKIPLTKTLVLLLFVMLMTVAVPVYAKPKTETGTMQTMTLATGEGEKVALWREGKIIWDEAMDVEPNTYYEGLGALPWIELEGATWITYNYEAYAPSDNSWYIYEKTFDIPGRVVSASMIITADNAYMLHVNGRLVGKDGNLFQPITGEGPLNWQTPETYDLTKALREGSNTVVVYVRNYGMPDGTWQRNPTGLVFNSIITYIG